MADWIEGGKHLYLCARLFEFNDILDLSWLDKIYEKAKQADDVVTIVQVIGAVSARYSPTNTELIQRLFIPAIEELTRLHESRWVNVLWYRNNCGELLGSLSNDEYDVIFVNLLYLDSIDYHTEDVLKHIAKKSPEKVIEFLGKRIERKSSLGIGSQYEDIPYEFHELAAPLSLIPEQAVNIVSGWYDGKYGLFIYSGGKILSNIFPDFPKTFEKCLLDLVSTSDKNKLDIVLAILRNYTGEPFLHDVCRQIVTVLPEDSKLLNEIEVILDTTGVVSGEDGFSKAYQRKIQEIDSWLQDEDEKVRKFAKRYINTLTKQIAAENRRAAEEFELRKHLYN